MAYAFRPNAIIEIAGRSLTAAEAGLQGLSVQLGLGSHGHAELSLWPGSAFAGAAPGDAFTLSLGPDGDESQVLTGTVSASRQMADRVVLEALDASGPLSRTRKTITFEESSVDDIVSRLAGEVSLSVDSDAGDNLAIYYVQAHRPLLEHLRDLARLTGRDLSTDADGTLLFRSADSGGSHTLRHGAELVAWDVMQSEAPGPVETAPHGTASESGTWHWVASDPLGDAPEVARIDGVIADRDLASVATEASGTRMSRAALGGHLLVTGNAEIRPADSAVVEDLPGGDPDPLRICAVHHRLDGQAGFTTRLQVEGGGTGGGLLGGLF